MRKLCCLLIILFSFSLVNAQTIIASGPTSFCQGDSVILSVTGATGTPLFQWMLNGAIISGATNPTLVVRTGGTYNLILTIGGVQQPPINNVIIIVEQPTSSFTFSPNNACANSIVQFTNTSTGTGLTYIWNFGDPASGSNNISTVTNPTHTFAGTPGIATQSFIIKLIATSANGCKDSITSSVTIKQRPDATLEGTGQTTYNGLPYFNICTSQPNATFTFINQSSTVTTNSSYTIVWGDASPNFTAVLFTSTSHTYNIGTYTLLFIVTGSNGCTDTTRYNVFVGSNPAVGFSTPGSTNICTGSSLTFPIENTASNPPGTTYTVTFNDGSPPIVFSHPPPNSVTHIFNSTSCGTNSSNGTITFPNSFSAVIVASNPCGISSIGVVPIYVSKKPVPNFSIAPRDTVCVNNIVTLTSTGTSGTISSNGNCNAGKHIWGITPGIQGTDYTILPGSSLGNDNGQTDPQLWTSGTNSIQLSFTTPGIYSVKLKVGANILCGVDSLVKTICVNQLPIAAFNVNSLIGCDAPLTVLTTNSSPTSFCGQNYYSWSVSYAPTSGCLPNTSSFSYINGTNSTSVNPQFQFTNPGIYTIGLITIAPGATCSSTVVTRIITIKGKPIVTLNSVPTICAGQSVTPTATYSCYIDINTIYAWSFPGGTPSSSTSPTPDPIVYSGPGSYTISLSVTNECGTTTANQQFNVSTQPTIPTVDNNGPLCSGSTLNLTANTSTTGVSYLWTGPGGFTSTSQNPVRPNATVAMGGTYTVAVTLNGCASAPATTTVVINQTPSNPVVTSPVNYCQNATAVPLTATGSAGNTFNWYTVATGGTASTTAPTPNTSAIGTTTYYVSQVSTTTPACESPRLPIVVNVYAVPNINGSYTDPTTCSSSNGTITITGLTPNASYSIQYIKDGGSPTTVTLTSNASGVIVISNLSGGIYANISASLNGCSSNIIGPFTLVNPSAPVAPTAGNNGPLCSGSTLNLTATSSSAGATYSWTGPGGFTSISQNPVRPNVTTAMSGTYSVTVSLNGCTSVPATTNVLIIQTPPNPVVASPVNYCQNDVAIPLTATGSTGNTFNWYTVPTGGGSNITAPTPVTSALGSVTYYVSQVTTTTPACESGRTPIVVNVYPVPAINGSYIDPTSCLLSNGTITLTGLTPAASYLVQYTLNGGTPITVTITSNASGTIVISNLPVGTYSNITASLNGCSSNIVGPYTLVNPTAPASPNTGSNSPICTGNTLNLTASSATPGVTYTWTGPGGFTSTSQNPVRINATTAMSGTYSVIITLNGCTSVPATINVVVNQTPPAPIVTTPVNYCLNAVAVSLTATGTSGNTLNWYTVPTGETASTTAPTPGTTTAGTTTYYVSQLNPLTPTCESPRTPLAVQINAIPNIISSSTAPTTCISNNGTITLSGLIPTTSYNVQYTFNGGTTTAILTSNNNGAIIITNLPAGAYTNITATLNGCSSNIAGPFLLINPLAPATPTAVSNSPLCAGSTLNLTATSTTTGVTYSWAGPGRFTSSLQNPSISNISTAESGRYYVMVRLNNCVSERDSIDVIVNINPIVNLGPDLLLAPGIQYPIIPAIQNGPIFQYLWTPGTNLSCSNCPLPIATIQSNISYIARVTNNFGCIARDTLNIKVICEKSQIFIPNAFTPDGDGINDILMIRAAGIVTIKYFRIFNKWGVLVFEKNNVRSNNPNDGWDGKVKGVSGPPDVYVYTVEVMCENGSSFIYKGNVSILK